MNIKGENTMNRTVIQKNKKQSSTYRKGYTNYWIINIKNIFKKENKKQ